MHMFLIKLQIAPHLRTICAIVSAKKKSEAIRRFSVTRTCTTVMDLSLIHSLASVKSRNRI